MSESRPQTGWVCPKGARPQTDSVSESRPQTGWVCPKGARPQSDICPQRVSYPFASVQMSDWGLAPFGQTQPVWGLLSDTLSVWGLAPFGQTQPFRACFRTNVSSLLSDKRLGSAFGNPMGLASIASVTRFRVPTGVAPRSGQPSMGYAARGGSRCRSAHGTSDHRPLRAIAADHTQHPFRHHPHRDEPTREAPADTTNHPTREPPQT